MKTRILLMDAFSTIHVGNGALIENTIKLLRRVYPHADIRILSLDTKTCSLKYEHVYDVLFNRYIIKKGKIHKAIWFMKQVLFMLFSFINIHFPFIKFQNIFLTEKQKETMREIEKADICISLSGEGINDIFYKVLPFWLFEYWIAIAKGKIFIQFPQSIGPLNNQWNRFIALKNAGLLVGRDKKSFEVLKSLRFDEEKTMFIPDVAIHQDTAENIDIHQYFSNHKKKILGLTISKIPSEIKTKKNYVDQIYDGIVRVLDKKEFKILLMPTNIILDGISADYQFCLNLKDKLSEQYETDILENRPYFPDEYKALQIQLEFFMSTRMHASIMATSGYVPTIAINTQHKIRGYMNNIGMDEYCIDMDNLEELPTYLSNLLENRDEIRNVLRDKIKSLKLEHDKLLGKIEDIVDDRE